MSTHRDLYGFACLCCDNSDYLRVTITAVADLTVDDEGGAA